MSAKALTSVRRTDSSRTSLLFDLDGCLLHTLPSIVRCWSETLTDFGLPVPTAERIAAQIGPPASVAASRFAPDVGEAMIDALVAAYRQRSAMAVDVFAFPGIPQVIARLRGRGVALAVATSKSIEVAEPFLRRLGLFSSFVIIEGTPVDEIGTDKVTVVGRAIRRLSPLRPAALIGDREHDIEGAHAHGLTAIGVQWGYGSADELTAAGADILVQTPADLEKYLLESILGS